MISTNLKTLIENSPVGKDYKGVIKVEPDGKFVKSLSDGCWTIFLNPRNEDVGHYVGLYVKGERAILFNSLGYENGKDRVKHLVEDKRTTFNVKVIQSPATNVCGFYVLYFFIRMREGATFKEFLGEFSSDHFANDHYVFEKTKSYFQ
jgi:hypothetical protein